MNTHALLEQHPSVQALSITQRNLNMAKATNHNRVINARPFTTASAVQRALKGGRKEERDTRVTAVRNDANILAAARAALEQRKAAFTVTSTSTIAPRREPESQHPPSGPDVDKPAKSQPPPKLSHTASLVSSAASSFEPSSSRAESYTDYSCSCCHPRRPGSVSRRTTAPSTVETSVSVPLSAYENMTSISERIAKTKAAVPCTTSGKPGVKSTTSASALTADSMTSSKLKTLENELEAERRHRMQTEAELRLIKERQEALLSRLSDADREEIRRIAAEKPVAAT